MNLYKLTEEQRHIDGNFLLFQQFNNITTIDKNTITADSTDTITISNIPTPSFVTIGSRVEEVIDGSLTFTIDLPGTYTVTVSCVAYLDKTFEVIAT